MRDTNSKIASKKVAGIINVAYTCNLCVIIRGYVQPCHITEMPHVHMYTLVHARVKFMCKMIINEDNFFFIFLFKERGDVALLSKL